METLSTILLAMFIVIIIIVILFGLYLHNHIKDSIKHENDTITDSASEENIIKVVEKMKKYYLLSLFIPGVKDKYYTYSGFCLHICGYLGIYGKNNILTFIRKYSNFTTSFEKITITEENQSNLRWFPGGDIKPRLKLLNKAIKNYYIVKAIEDQKKEDLEENY